MNKNFLKKANLYESHKQFMRLCNESYISTSMLEADDDENMLQGNEENPQQMPQPANGMAQEGFPPMPQDNPNGQMDNQEPNGDEGGLDVEPQLDDNVPSEELDAPSNDDEVIDVNDLTNAQEKLNKKQNQLGQDMTSQFGHVDDRINNLLKSIEDMKGIIDHNNNEIESLRSELEKRVPTQKERLEMQSLHSYPFDVNPYGYWKEKEKEGVYQAEYDNKQPKEYKIKQSDIDNYNPTEIDKSMDDKFKVTMQDLFKNF